MRQFIPAILLLLFSAIFALFALIKLPENATQIAVLYPFDYSLTESIAAADKAGMVTVRTGAFNNLIIVKKEPDKSIDNLYSEGALLVLDPLILGGCFQ